MNQVELLTENFNKGGIIETTLREGEQFAGGRFVEGENGLEFGTFEFTYEQAAIILGFTHAIGINKAEVPNPLVPGMDSLISNLVKIPERPKLLSHIRNHPKDLTAAIAVGVDGVNILTTVDAQRITNMGHTYESYWDQLIRVVLEAQANRLETRVSVEHSWNGDFDKALQVFQLAETLGVDRIGMADTIGIATHWEVAERIKAVRGRVRVTPIEVHFHQDCQSAVANSIEALAAGANHVDTTFDGIGERTGITPLSALLVRFLTINPEIIKQHGLNLKLLSEAEQYVAKLAGICVPFNLPTAPNAFAHKAGIHLNGVTTIGTHLYQLIEAGEIGGNTTLITTARISGKAQRNGVNS